MKNKMVIFISFIFIIISCEKEKRDENNIFKVLNIKTYDKYLKNGYTIQKGNLGMLEKEFNDYSINLEFYDDEVYTKSWVFKINDSISIEDNLKKIALKYGLVFHHVKKQDSINYTLSAMKNNIFLYGVISIRNDYKPLNNIYLSYPYPQY